MRWYVSLTGVTVSMLYGVWTGGSGEVVRHKPRSKSIPEKSDKHQICDICTFMPTFCSVAVGIGYRPPICVYEGYIVHPRLK
ncbi:hypothetical protein BC629DRAFT_643208 [Irpex lacteus]|nr:hypothetical protein BC629DRAFT_643208 [Irpex lacteus]